MIVKLWMLLVVASSSVDAFALHRSMTRSVAASTSTALSAEQKTAVIAGATGYIGRSVVREAVRQGFKTIALVRDASKIHPHPLPTNGDSGNQKENSASAPKSVKFEEFFNGAELIECDVTDAAALEATMKQIAAAAKGQKIDAIVSCLASRSGIKKDAYLIDYQATLNCLSAGRAAGAGHFVLLSAFCCKNPWLQFQQAKILFEKALQEQTDMTYSIVRPTAFFKSVSGQLEVVQSGAPFVSFGNGEITRCNPIAESDLATYLMDCVTDKSRHQRIINLGGPDEPLTMKMQGEMLFEATGMKPNFVFAPVWIFDLVINTLQFLADLTKNEALENAAETGRIGKYYAVEDMLTTDPEEKYGTITLQEHYNRIAQEGQEYDPYTTMFSSKRVNKEALERVKQNNVNGAAVAVEGKDAATVTSK